MNQKKDDRSDEELMALYQSGDFAAFECLYLRHSGRIFEYLKTKVVLPAAQDLLQEVFLKMHRSRAQYSAQYPVLPWLFTISRNTIVDYFKHSETQLAKRATSQDFAFENVTTDLKEVAPAPHDLALMLNSLSDVQRRAIELRYLSDWSFEQIALEMQTSPENIRQIVSRGIKKIRSLVKGGKK